MKPLRITVEPSASHPDVLDVRDAMQQVLDFFDLLTDRTNRDVVWNLTFASTNSPFVAEGQPVDLRTNAGAYSAIAQHISMVERAFQRMAAGEPLESDFPADKAKIAENFLERNLSGIGRTECDFGSDEPVIEFRPQIAERSLSVIRNETDVLHNYLFSTFSRREYGSVYGRIVHIGMHYDKPAIHILEHISNREIWCQVDNAAREEMERNITAGDVWKHRRVRVRGQISYDASGKISRVYDASVFCVNNKEASIDDLHEPDFTEGLSPYQYIEKLRENDVD